MAKLSRYLTPVLLLALCCVGQVEVSPAAAEQEISEEYRVKAGFLFNFTKFITWPEESFPSESSPFVVCVYKTNPFGPLLGALSARTVKDREVSSFIIESVNRTSSCHVLFVPSDQMDKIPKINKQTEERHVLVVSEGGAETIISFIQANKRVRFQIDQARAERAGLRISSQLLKLAVLK